MNFLAHAHLSGENPDLLLGNLVADAVKGKQMIMFPEQVANGILLHRQIDAFTDAHEIVKKSTGMIRKEVGKYSGVVVDIYYDHFLARKWSKFSDIPLYQFTVEVYRILGNHYYLLPSRVKRALPYMIAQNWLNSYASLKDLRKIFYGMDRRTNFISGMSQAVEILKLHYSSLERDFEDFYPEMMAFASDIREEIVPSQTPLHT